MIFCNLCKLYNLCFIYIFIFSLFRISSESEAVEVFNLLSFKLLALCKIAMFFQKDRLQEISNIVRNNPRWGCAHIAAKLGVVECFSEETVIL